MPHIRKLVTFCAVLVAALSLASCGPRNIVSYHSLDAHENLFFGRLIFADSAKNAWHVQDIGMTFADGQGEVHPVTCPTMWATAEDARKGNRLCLFSFKAESNVVNLKEINFGQSGGGYIFRFVEPYPSIKTDPKENLYYLGDIALAMAGQPKDEMPQVRLAVLNRMAATSRDFAGASGIKGGTKIRGKAFTLKGHKYRVIKRTVVYHYVPGFTYHQHSHHR